jgi:hypothetical protein
VGFAAAHLAAVVLQVAGDVRADPPHGVGAEAIALARIEVLDRLEQADVALLDEVVDARAAVPVLLGHRDHQGEVRGSQDVLRPQVALARAARQLAFLLTRQVAVLAKTVEVGGHPLELRGTAHRSAPCLLN